MATTTFIVDDLFTTGTPLQVEVTLTEVTLAGFTAIQVTLDTGVNEFGLADLRGFFFNVANDSLLSSLSVSGSPVTAFDFTPPADLPNDADITGGGAPSFEAGVQIGTPGGGTDFYDTATFTLSVANANFTLADLIGQQIGIRATSVPDGEGGTGSSKLGGEVTFEISGTKYLDANGDGDTTGDSGLGNVTIFVDLNDNGLNDDGIS